MSTTKSWRWTSAAVLFLLLCLPTFAQTATRGPSTPEERAKALKLTRQLEQAPLGATAQEDRRWLLKWIQDIPDITVNICPALLPELARSNRNFGHDLWLQTMFSAAVFMIEHPDDPDEDAPYIAGIEGALKAYENLLKVRPEAHWQILDDLLQRRAKGELGPWVREKVDKECAPERQPT